MANRALSVFAKRMFRWLRSNYMLTPKIFFVSTYFSLIHQLVLCAFPGRRRGSLFEWMLSLAMLTQANEMWKYMTLFVDFATRCYKQGEPYQVKLWQTTVYVPPIESNSMNFVFGVLVGCLPLVGSYVLARRQRRFRVTWLDIRRRYRNEIGSARYYLTRPLTPLEEPDPKLVMKKSRSEELLPRTIKRLPKMPRTA